MFRPRRIDQQHRRPDLQRTDDGVPGATDTVAIAVIPDTNQQVGLLHHHPPGKRGLRTNGGAEMTRAQRIVRRCERGLE